MNKWICAAGLLASCSAFGLQVDKFQFKAGQIKSAVIHNSTGNVHVAPVADNMAYVVVNKIKWGPRCHANVDVKDGELNVQMDDTAWILDHECRVDLIISIPEKIPLQVRAGTGDVKLTGSRGDIDVKVGSGLISLKGDIASLKALSGSGDIKLLGNAQKADIKTGSGDIELDYQSSTSTGQLSVHTGTGDVEVYLPPATNVKSQITAGNGTVLNEFTASKATESMTLDAASETGNIQIRKK